MLDISNVTMFALLLSARRLPLVSARMYDFYNEIEARRAELSGYNNRTFLMKTYSYEPDVACQKKKTYRSKKTRVATSCSTSVIKTKIRLLI